MADDEQLPLFEVISADEYYKGTTSAGQKGSKTEPRTLTVWYDLVHGFGFCTVQSHDEIQKRLNPEQKEYRQVYPSRMVYKIGEYFVCRECFLEGADKE